jgi:hypothetical protein
VAGYWAWARPSRAASRTLTDSTEYKKLLLKKLRAKSLDHDRCAGNNSQKTKTEVHGCVKQVQSKGMEKLCIKNINQAWKEN